MQNIEKRYGAASVATFLADAGMILSGLSAIVNAIFLGTNIASKYKINNQALLANPWLVTVLVISAIANMSGFILFNVLGARNGFLLVEKHSAEIKAKDDLIKKLEGRIIMPMPPATKHNSTDAGSVPFHSAAGALVQDRALPLPAGEAVLENDEPPLS